MEPKFQSSFIPKTPIVSPSINGASPNSYNNTNIFSVIATAFFVVTILVAGGLFGYKMILNNQIEKSIGEIDQARAALEIEKIESLVQTNSKIVSLKNLLDNHVSVSGLIDLMQTLTVKNISFTNFDFSSDAGELKLLIKGQSQSYNALAKQGDLLRESGLIKDPKFFGFSPTTNGTITFDFSASVSLDLVSYKKAIESTSPTQ